MFHVCVLHVLSVIHLSKIIYSLVFHQNPEIWAFPVYTQIFSVITFPKSNYLKLVWIILMKKSNRHPH